MVKVLTFSKTRVSIAQIDVSPNYRPSSCNSSFRKLVPALMQSIKNSAKEVELDQSSTSALKPGPSKQSDNFPLNPAPNNQSKRTDEAMELDVYGPSLRPQF